MSRPSPHSPKHRNPRRLHVAAPDLRAGRPGRRRVCALGVVTAALLLLAGAAGAEAPDAAALRSPVAAAPTRPEVAPPAAPALSASPSIDDRLPIGARRGWRSSPRITEAAIADAIAHRSPDRSPARPASGFRDRSADLFRSDHPVEIGEQEMLLRLRLRAKARETMSVELRF